MMIRLHTLGSLSILASDGHPVEPLMRQPGRMSLLVYLAVQSRTSPITRDELIGMFWGERPEHHARRALSQALHFLRKELGEGVVIASGGRVSIDPGRLTCDAVSMLALADARSWSAAADLYSGEFMPGSISRVARVGHWVDAERARIRRIATDAAWRAAEQHALDDDRVQAVAYAERAVVMSGFEDATVLRTMRLLDTLDCGALAARIYARYVQHRAQELELDPSPAVASAADQLRRPDQIGAARPTALRVRHEAGTPAARVLRIHRDLRGKAIMGAAAMMTFVVLVALWGFLGPAVPPSHELRPADITLLDGSGEGPEAGVFINHVAHNLASVGHSVRLLSSVGEPAPLNTKRSRPAVSVRLRPAPTSDDSVALTALIVDALTSDVHTGLRAAWPRAESNEETRQAAERLSVALRQAVGAKQRRDRSLGQADHPALRSARRDRARADSLHAAGNMTAAQELLNSIERDLMALGASVRGKRRALLERAAVAESMMWLSFAAPMPARTEGRAALDRALKALEATASSPRQDPEVAVRMADLMYWQWRTAPADSAWAFAAARDRARWLLEAVTKQEPDNSLAWARLAAIYETEADFARGYRAAGRAIATDLFAEFHYETSVRLYSLALEIGDTASSRRWCGNFPAEHWVRADCELTLAYHRGNTSSDDVERLRALIARAVENPHGAWNAPGLQLLLAAVLASAGNTAEALEIESQTVAAAVDEPDLLLYRAKLRMALQDFDAADAFLKEYIGIRPSTRTYLRQSAWFRQLGLR